VPSPIDYDQVTAAFGYVLAKLRAESGLPQDEFARKVGIDPSYYRGLESAVYAPSLYYLMKIAHGAGRAPQELVAATCERLAALALEVQGVNRPARA
jgi:transcriptional regulator with XRE-family HTH domain